MNPARSFFNLVAVKHNFYSFLKKDLQGFENLTGFLFNVFYTFFSSILIK